MSDLVWSLAIGVLFVILGLVFIRLGLEIWKKQKTELIIRHHMDRVSDEDKQAYCRQFGIGMLVIGIGFAVSGIWLAITIELYGLIPMTAGLAAGVMLITGSAARYNR